MKKYAIYLLSFIVLLLPSSIYGKTYIEDFQDGNLNPEWYAYKTYTISNGYMHMLEGQDYGSIKESEVGLWLTNEIINHFQADVNIPEGYEQLVGIGLQWGRVTGSAAWDGYQVFLKFNSSSKTIDATLGRLLSDGSGVLLGQVTLKNADFDIWYNLGITINSNYIRFEIDGDETDLFHGLFDYNPTSISDNVAYVHGHDGIPDVNYFLDNITASTIPITTHLINTTWHQSPPYRFRSDFDNDGQLDDFNQDGKLDEWVVGCNAIAVGQLINYYYEQGKYDLGWLHNIPIVSQGETLNIFYNYNIGNKDYTNKIRIHTGGGIYTEKSYVQSITQDNPFAFEGTDLHFEKIFNPIFRQDIYMPYSATNSLDDNKNKLQEFLIWVGLGLESSYTIKNDNGTQSYVTNSELDKNLLIERFHFSNKVVLTKRFNLDRDGLSKYREYITNSIDNGDPILIKLHGITRDAMNKQISTGHTALIDGYTIDESGYLQLRLNWGFTDSSLNGFYPNDTNTPYLVIDVNNDGNVDFKFFQAQIFMNTSPDI